MESAPLPQVHSHPGSKHGEGAGITPWRTRFLHQSEMRKIDASFGARVLPKAAQATVLIQAVTKVLLFWILRDANLILISS